MISANARLDLTTPKIHVKWNLIFQTEAKEKCPKVQSK